MAAEIPPGVDLSQIPLQINPAQPSNFENPTSLAAAITGLGVSLAVISLAFVVFRLWANGTAARKLGIDDLFCTVGFIFTLAYTGLAISINNTARHAWDVPLSFITPSYTKRTYALNMVYAPSICFAKLAIFALYLRLFSAHRAFKVLVYFGIAVVSVTYCLSIPLATVYCVPYGGANWDLTVLLKCDPTSALAVAQGVIGLVSDIYLFILPLPIIFHLNMNRKRKLGLIAVFMTGLFAICASALGLFYKVQNFRKLDPSWNAATSEICVLVENYTTIVVSCTPAIALFWKNVVIPSSTFASLQSLLRNTGSLSSENRHKSSTGLYSGRHGSNKREVRLRTEKSVGELDRDIESNGAYNSMNGASIIKSVSVDQKIERSSS